MHCLLFSHLLFVYQKKLHSSLLFLNIMTYFFQAIVALQQMTFNSSHKQTYGDVQDWTMNSLTARIYVGMNVNVKESFSLSPSYSLSHSLSLPFYL